jgi:hypothetical protein
MVAKNQTESTFLAKQKLTRTEFGAVGGKTRVKGRAPSPSFCIKRILTKKQKNIYINKLKNSSSNIGILN